MLTIYLFVIGEAVDAVQNRKIRHIERVQMLLRGKAFLDLWKLFLNTADYALSRHFISPQAYSIAQTFIEGALGLIYISPCFPG